MVRVKKSQQFSLQAAILEPLLLPLELVICTVAEVGMGMTLYVMGKPWENHRKTIGKWWFHGILWGLPCGYVKIAIETDNL